MQQHRRIRYSKYNKFFLFHFIFSFRKPIKTSAQEKQKTKTWIWSKTKKKIPLPLDGYSTIQGFNLSQRKQNQFFPSPFHIFLQFPKPKVKNTPQKNPSHGFDPKHTHKKWKTNMQKLNWWNFETEREWERDYRVGNNKMPLRFRLETWDSIVQKAHKEEEGESGSYLDGESEVVQCKRSAQSHTNARTRGATVPGCYRMSHHGTLIIWHV